MLTIVTPVLNGERFIKKNIESISKLNFPHEHIIVDGGSTDGTHSILKKYSHLKIYSQVGREGMYDAIKQGFEKANGDLISWINCDDYIIPDRYEKMAYAFDASSADFCYSDSYIDNVQTNKKTLCRCSPLPKYFINNGILPFLQPSSIYRKDFYERVGGLDISYKIAGDMELFKRMVNLDSSVFLLFKIPTVCFLKYGQSLGDLNTCRANAELIRAGIPNPSLLCKSMFFLLRRFR